MNLRNGLLLLILAVLTSLTVLTGFEVSGPNFEPETAIPEDIKIESKKISNEAQILASYLAKYNSPLQYHAQDFIDAANLYDIDWKLVPSIAGVESTFGKRIPGGYNAWGWGVYGTNRIYFKSWKDGIYTLSKGLKEDYISRGLTTPYTMNKRYAASPAWGWKVAFFMNDLEKYAKNYDIDNQTLDVSEPDFKIAAVSAAPTK